MDKRFRSVRVGGPTCGKDQPRRIMWRLRGDDLCVDPLRQVDLKDYSGCGPLLLLVNNKVWRRQPWLPAMTLFDKVYWRVPPEIRHKYDRMVLDGDEPAQDPEAACPCGCQNQEPPRAGTFSRLRTGGDQVNTTGLSGLEDTDPLHSVTTYHDYPSTQPFINDPYRRPADKPVNTYPESNRQAVMSALKGLQNKIRKLELERSTAEDNLKMLATETSRYHDILQQGPDLNQMAPHTTVSQNTQGNSSPAPELPHTQPTDPTEHTELESHLQAAENRSNLLEKQLEYMRRMVHAAEADRSQAVSRSQALEAQRAKDSQFDFSESRRKEKLVELEREHIKLTATQNLAENKIRDLEEKLREERHHRKLMQERAAQMMSSAEANRILAKTGNVPKKYKKKVVTQKAHSHPPAGNSNGWSDHYRLNLADMPFVAGKSTGPSHSVPANVQKVLSMMKSHNNVLCPCSPRTGAEPPTRDYSSTTRMTNGHDTVVTNGHDTAAANGHLLLQPTRASSAPRNRPSSKTDLASLLLQLQDEFGYLSYEHQELSSQIHEATDPRLRDDLERELDHIVAKMETKGDQIAMLRKHQEVLHKKKKKAKAVKTRPASASARMPSSITGEVEVRTTIKTKGGAQTTASSYARPTASSAGKASLKFLQDLKKIQSTLRKDDLSWDC